MYVAGQSSDEVMRVLNDISRIIDQNNLNQVDYNSDALEKVRDDCADFLKSLEMNVKEILEPAHIDINEGLGEAVSDMKVREILPINSKSNLDKAADKSAKLLRLRSGSRTKDLTTDSRAPWDPHHKQCVQDTMQTLRQDN